MFIVSKDQNSAVLLKEGRPPRHFVAGTSYRYCKGCALFSPDIREGRDAHCYAAFDTISQNPYCCGAQRTDRTEIIWKEVTQ